MKFKFRVIGGVPVVMKVRDGEANGPVILRGKDLLVDCRQKMRRMIARCLRVSIHLVEV